MHFRVIAHLDGSGIVYDPAEPPMLDAVLAWAFAGLHGARHLEPDQTPERIPLPLVAGHIGGVEMWRASAFQIDGPQAETLIHWRKRFRLKAAPGLTEGSPNLTNGAYRDWQMPLHLTLCHRLVAYGSGDRREVRRALDRWVKFLGRKKSQGHGRVLRWEVEETPEDWSWAKDGLATRWLPSADGTRLVRPMPPYWHPIGRVRMGEIGDPAP